MEIQDESKWFKKRWLLILGVIFLAFNLRPAITAVGPLIATIQKSLGINNLEAGLLTTIPLIAFAVLSPLVAKFSRRWGNEKTLFLALLILTAGIFIRYSHQLGFLYAGTLIIGSGIAVMNVLLPSVIKSDFPKRIGLMTSIYTTAMCAMAGLASGVSVPLAEGAGLGWEKAMASWGFLAIIGIALWIPQLKANKTNSSNQAAAYPHPSIWKSRTAWHISLFFGFQSFVFYCLIAWLPAILLSKGMDESTAGWMLLFVQIIGLPSTFFAPILFYQAGLLVASIAMIGLSTGGSISIAYMIISTKAKDHQQAAELSGMAQAAGYFLAAFGPVLLGFTFDQTNRWLEPILLILLVNAFMVLAGTHALRSQAKIN